MMEEQRLILARQLSQLEVDKAGIDHVINEIQRRFALLDEVESWGLLVQKSPCPDYPAEDSRNARHEIQDNHGVSGDGVTLVPAGDSFNGFATWTPSPLVA